MAVARGRNSLNKDFFEEGGGIFLRKGVVGGDFKNLRIFFYLITDGIPLDNQ